jgi:DNA-binding NarL/FixJ family response regulator
MLIEDEPIFRLGLVTCLNQSPDLQVVLTAETAFVALQQLAAQTQPVNAPTAELLPIEIILLSLDLGQQKTGQTTGLSLCQQLKERYPTLPILLLSTTPDPVQLAAALQTGAEGYCAKSASQEELLTAIRRVAAGRTHWMQGMQVIAQALSATQTPPSARRRALGWTPFLRLRRRLRQYGLQQIDATIAALSTELQRLDLSELDRLYMTGRLRELRAAHWLVDRLIASAPSSPEPVPPSQQPRPEWSSVSASEPRSQSPEPPTATAAGALLKSDSTSLRSLRSALFDDTAARLQFSLRNLTSTPLEIDILKEEKKRELLYIILRQLETILDELRFSQVTAEQLVDRCAAILQDLWQASLTDFFGKYYTVPVSDPPIVITETLRQDAALVQTAILDKIPLVTEFLTHLLFQTPLPIDDVAYAAGTIEAMQRSEMLLQNLAIQMANAVMQPLLNRFGDVVAIKQTFYDKRLLSSREIERFRNNLSWKYRVTQYFTEPTAIFESRHSLLVLTDSGIAKASIYTPRNIELAQLAGIPFAVTLALEARDALAPRLRSAISFVGSGVVYLLTEVIGRGIGLIGRGVIKGIGNALQDNKPNRSR